MEPFSHERTWRKVVKYLTLYALFYGALSFTLFWAGIAQTENEKKLACGSTRPWIYYIVVVLFNYILARIMKFASEQQLQPVFSRRKLNFKSFTRYVPNVDTKVKSIEYSGKLSSTVQDIRVAIEEVKRGESDLFTVTRFLLSKDGKSFLKRACKGVSRFSLIKGKLVRRDSIKYWAFCYTSTCCCVLSLAGAFSSADNCRSRAVFFSFLEFLTVTLLTVMAFTSFCGITEHSQLLYVNFNSHPVTEDEKFLISLLAANSDGTFSGFYRNDFSGYANVASEGNEDVFVPMHMSLFAYREARTYDDEGFQREYDREADDCVGNYDMIGISPIVIS